MALFIKITITDFKHASRDKREISVVKELGHRVEVVAKSNDGTKKIGVQDGYKVHYLSTRSLGNSKYLVKINRIFSVFNWAMYIRKLNANCLSGHNLEAAVIGWLSNLFKKDKAFLIYDPHEYTLKTKEKSKWKFLNWLFVSSLEKFIINKSEFTLTVNDSISEAMRSDYSLHEKPLVVRNIANFWHIDPLINNLKRKEICESLDIATTSFIIMYHGSVMKGRGIETLFESVKLAGTNLAVVILGYGDSNYKNQLNKKAFELKIPVYFNEAVPIENLWQYIGAVDVGVSLATNSCTNHYFMLPNKIFENIQALTPLIASDFPEIRRIIEGYKIGVCCDASDVKSIANSIIKLKNDKDFYATLKMNLIPAKKELCWENEKKVLEIAYQSVFEKLT